MLNHFKPAISAGEVGQCLVSVQFNAPVKITERQIVLPRKKIKYPPVQKIMAVLGYSDFFVEEQDEILEDG